MSNTATSRNRPVTHVAHGPSYPGQMTPSNSAAIYATSQRGSRPLGHSTSVPSDQPQITRRPHYNSQNSGIYPLGWTGNSPHLARVQESHQTPVAAYSTLPRNAVLFNRGSGAGAPGTAYRAHPQHTFNDTGSLHNGRGGGGGGGIYHTMRMSSTPQPGHGTMDFRRGNPRPMSPLSTLQRASVPPRPSDTMSNINTLTSRNTEIVRVKGCAPCVVTMLDGTDQTFQVKRSAKGQELFDKVCAQLDLKEKDYFALAYRNTDKIWCWLRLHKKISNYLDKTPWFFEFRVKFYPPEPRDLQDDLTRYLLCLQVRQDILSKKLPLSYFTLVVLNAYIVQSEVGDHDTSLHATGDYVVDLLLVPPVLHSPELITNIMEVHKQIRGLLPEKADLHFLSNAKKLALYGIEFHTAKDLNQEEVNIGLHHMGILIYMKRLRINRFFWPKIVKVSYLRSSFRVFLRPNHNEMQLRFVEFRCENAKKARRLWKACVEFHTFYRLRDPALGKKRTALPQSFITRHFRRSGTPSTGESPSSPSSPSKSKGYGGGGGSFSENDDDLLEESSATWDRSQQPVIHRRHANRKAWLAKDNSHLQPVNIGCQPGQQNGYDAWDFADSLGQQPQRGQPQSDAYSLRGGDTLNPRPRLVTSQALKQPPPGGSRMVRPTPQRSANSGNSNSGNTAPYHSTQQREPLPEESEETPTATPKHTYTGRNQPGHMTMPGPPPVIYPQSTSTPAPNVVTAPVQARPNLPGPKWRWSHVDATPLLLVDKPEGLTVRDNGLSAAPQGCRANWGVSQYGKYYYEVRVTQAHTEERMSTPCVRVGWATSPASLVLGEDKEGFGYGAPNLRRDKNAPPDHYSVRVTGGESQPEGLPLAHGDVIGCFLDLNLGRVHWSRNGLRLSNGVLIPAAVLKEALFPACSMRNCTVQAHFDEKSLLHRPDGEWVPLSRAPSHVLVANRNQGWRLNAADSTLGMDLSPDGLVAQARLNRGWQGSRANAGIVPHKGQYYFEVKPLEMDPRKESGVLVGWSTEATAHPLGEDPNGVAYGGTLFHANTQPGSAPSGPVRGSFGVVAPGDGLSFDKIPQTDAKSVQSPVFQAGDVIGCSLDYTTWTVHWHVNGELVQTQVTVQPRLRQHPLFPTVALKNSTLHCNFGDQPFLYQPATENGCVGVSATPEEFVARSSTAATPTSAPILGKNLWTGEPSASAAASGMGPSSSFSSSPWSGARLKSSVSYPESNIQRPANSTLPTSSTPAQNPMATTYRYAPRNFSGGEEPVGRGPRNYSGSEDPTGRAYLHQPPPVGVTGRERHVSSGEGSLVGEAPGFAKEYTTVIEGEPTVETETYIAEDGSRVTRTVKRKRIITKTATATSYPVEEVSSNPMNQHQHQQPLTSSHSSGFESLPVMSSSSYPLHQGTMTYSGVPQHVQPVYLQQQQQQSPHQQHYVLQPNEHTHHHTHHVSPSQLTKHEEVVMVPTVPSGDTVTSCPSCWSGSSNAPGGCGHGIPAMVTKTTYYCYHPSPHESKEEAMARLTEAIQLAEGSTPGHDGGTTDIVFSPPLASNSTAPAQPVPQIVVHAMSPPPAGVTISPVPGPSGGFISQNSRLPSS